MDSRILLVLVAAMTQSAALSAQKAKQLSADGQIRGVIRDSAGAPIANVVIVARTTGRRVFTNHVGYFSVGGVGSGEHVLVVRRIGFAAESLLVPLGMADTADVDGVLRPVAMELDAMDVNATIAVAARLQGFEHRRGRNNGGQFITREQIDRRGSMTTADMLRGVPGIKMIDSMGVTIATSSRGAKLNLLSRKAVEACVVRVGVDGQLKDPSFALNMIPLTDIHGIEVYAGPATTPPEFNSSAGRNAQCGLVMIWTRSR